VLLEGSDITPRGYTFHEHIPNFGLINMNGRMYDPVLARFLSPDPYVQMPDFSQSFNRYAYCLNNPFKFTDPSGEKLQWWHWMLIGMGADILSGGAISLTAAATATAVSAIVTTNAVSLMAFNTATYTLTLPFQHTLSTIDMVTNACKGNWKGVWNSMKIDFGIANSFLSTFYFDKSATPLEWGLQIYNNFSFGEQLQTSIGRGFAHIQNIGGYVDEVGYYKGRTIVRLQGDYVASSQFTGVSFGHYVFGRNMALNPNDDAKYNLDLLAHEYGHTYQSRIMGPMYLFRIGIASAMGGHSTEADANRRGFGNLGITTTNEWYLRRTNSTYKWWEFLTSPVTWPFMWMWNK
jgi:RHS repeat-associated protein